MSTAISSHINVTMKECESLIITLLKANLVPMIHGSPGCGKSSLIKKIAETFKLKLIDYRLSQAEPTDFMGFPFLCQDSKRAHYFPLDTFPLKGTPIPEGYNGWLIFLDELNQGSKAVQRASYRLLLDREVGMEPLHENAFLIGAGNLITDGASVEEVNTAQQSRLVHLFPVVDPKEWQALAFTLGIDQRIISFIDWQPEMLHKFDPNHTDCTFSCPRTWEFTSKIIQQFPNDIPESLMPVLAGTLSRGVASEFHAYTVLYQSAIRYEQVIANPLTAPVPEDPGLMYALTGSLGSKAQPNELNLLLQYLNRLPKEFQILTLRNIIRRHASMNPPVSLQTHPDVMQWKLENNYLFE